MSLGKGVITGHLVTLRRLARTFFVGFGATLRRRGGGDLFVDLWRKRKLHRKDRPTVTQDARTEGLFTVEYPDERLPVYERYRMIPVLIYDEDDGNVRCTSCNICAKVCPPQCIWMVHARGPNGKPVPQVEEFFIDADVCMNCGLCAEYCPFDAIKMDQNFELSNYERQHSHILTLQDLLVSSAFYARTHPQAWASAEEVAERGKVAKKKDQRAQKLQTALGTSAAAATAATPTKEPVSAPA